MVKIHNTVIEKYDRFGINPNIMLLWYNEIIQYWLVEAKKKFRIEFFDKLKSK